MFSIPVCLSQTPTCGLLVFFDFMETHSSVLAWRIPGIREPGGLPSMGLHTVGHDLSDLAAAAEYIMRNAGLDEAQTGIKIAGRNINNLRYADDTTLMAENE